MAARTPTARREQGRQVKRLMPPGSVKTAKGWRRETWTTEKEQD